MLYECVRKSIANSNLLHWPSGWIGSARAFTTVVTYFLLYYRNVTLASVFISLYYWSSLRIHYYSVIEWLLLLKYTSLANSLLAIIYKFQSSMMKSRGDLSSQVEELGIRNPREIMRVFSVRPFTNVIVILQRKLSNI